MRPGSAIELELGEFGLNAKSVRACWYPDGALCPYTSAHRWVVTLVVFLAYTFLENHFLNPVVMARTVKTLLVFVAVLVGANIGNWLGGLFGGFVAVLLAVPIAASIQVVIVEIWRASAPDGFVENGQPPIAVPPETQSP